MGERDVCAAWFQQSEGLQARQGIGGLHLILYADKRRCLVSSGRSGRFGRSERWLRSMGTLEGGLAEMVGFPGDSDGKRIRLQCQRPGFHPWVRKMPWRRELTSFPSIRVFSNESALCIRWPKYWIFSISPSSEHPGLISFRMDWLDLLAVQGTLKSLLQHHSSKASILWRSAFFRVQLSHPYMTTGKTIALTM